MKPTKFKESTKVLQRPSTMSDDECSALPVFCDGKQCISCWKPSIKERFLILIFGRVWLGVLSGKTQPPVFLSGQQVFVKAPLKTRILTLLSNLKEWITDLFKSVKAAFAKPKNRKLMFNGFVLSFLVGMFLPWLGLAIAILIGAMKECWRLKSNNKTGWFNLAFSCLGALLAYPFAYLIHALNF